MVTSIRAFGVLLSLVTAAEVKGEVERTGSELHRAEDLTPAVDMRAASPVRSPSGGSAGQANGRVSPAIPTAVAVQVQLFDPLGAVVPGALVTATETETDIEVAREIANRDGLVSMKLSEGREYRLSASLRCFGEEEVTLRYSTALLALHLSLPFVGCDDVEPAAAPIPDKSPDH